MFHRIQAEIGIIIFISLGDGDLVIVEIQFPFQVDTFPEIHRAPIRSDCLGIQPSGKYLRITDCCRQSNDLHCGI